MMYGCLNVSTCPTACLFDLLRLLTQIHKGVKSSVARHTLFMMSRTAGKRSNKADNSIMIGRLVQKTKLFCFTLGAE